MQHRRIIVSLVAAVAAAQFAHGSSHDVKAEIFGGQRNFDAFRSTHFFTMERLHAIPTDSENPYPREPENLSSYRRQNSVRLSSEQIKELKNLLTRPSSYEWDSTKACAKRLFCHSDQSGGISYYFCRGELGQHGNI
jgi:hypothetical protein